jgi:hypothetical protein
MVHQSKIKTKGHIFVIVSFLIVSATFMNIFVTNRKNTLVLPQVFDYIGKIPQKSTDPYNLLIIGDDELTSYCTGQSGDGSSWDQAYIIENLNVKGNSSTPLAGIEIRETNKYLVITYFISTKF